MARKTAEQKTREFEETKALRPKVLMRSGVVVPEVLYVKQKSYEHRISCHLQEKTGLKTRPYIGYTQLADIVNRRLHQ